MSIDFGDIACYTGSIINNLLMIARRRIENMARIKIDMNSMIFEAEGEEEFVKSVLEEFKRDFKSGAISTVANVVATETSKDTTTNDSEQKKQIKTKKGGATRKKESYGLVKDLNLIPNDKKSLKDFYAGKAPSSAMEKTATFIYYLKNELSVDKVGLNHIYTCYKAVGEPVPGALKQNVADTSSRKGYIYTGDFDDITVTVAGENFIEHELPKPIKVTK
jgi:hypothetical protein